MSDHGERTSSGSKEVPPNGLPQGITVALVGDPGTGKTTFLLEYFKHSKIKSGSVRFTDDRPLRVGLVGFADDRPMHVLDQLLRTNIEPTSPEKGGVLRCFISLESSFERMCVTHRKFFSGNEGNASKDRFVFIDATSFLSGRLEDELRYPRLFKQLQDDRVYQLFRFSLSGGKINVDDTLHFLDDSSGHTINPKPLSDVLHDHCDCTKQNNGEPPKNKSCSNPFCTSNNKQHHAFLLLTRPVANPHVRIRLLKDLLAEIFSRFDKLHRLVLIDSLSALLANYSAGNTLEDDEANGRRLHILNLIRWLEEHNVTTLFSSEAVREAGHTLRRQPLFLGTQERYVAAGVIQLDYHQYRSGDLIRYLRVLKMRGAGHDMRPHAYDIDQNGISWIEPLFGEPDTEGAL